MAAACFQLHNYDLFEKVGLKLSPLTQNSVQQDYLLSNSLLTKNIKKLLHLPGVDCPPFPWTFMGNPGDEGGGGESYPRVKNLLISPIRKIPLNGFKSFTMKNFISSPSNSNFRLITLSTFICSCTHRRVVKGEEWGTPPAQLKQVQFALNRKRTFFDATP